MLILRRSIERGHADHGWLRSAHTFSFADYVDPAWPGFGNLRVINEDRIAAGTGFGTHGHRDMEIVSYVIEGALAHRDSLGHGATIVPGELQRMSAGTGVRHSEFNHQADAPTHFLQIWLLPRAAGIAPGYEQQAFAPEDQRGRLRLVASEDGRDGSVTVHADAAIHAGRFDGDEAAELALAPGRRAWVQVVRGRLQVNGQDLAAGDGLGLVDEAAVRLGAGQDAEVLVFDLAG
ncbi:MAG: hypothetical protein RL223_3547 [Pseudomonadota bacterium]|jgi:redox-sensitive bicupin YhaK (pirin superfamily)